MTPARAARLALLACALMSACTFRAAIPEPRQPLAATPGDALPGPPTETMPEAPFRMRLVRRTLDNGFSVYLSRGAANGVVSVVFVDRAATRWDTRSDETVTSLMTSTMFRATRLEDGRVVDDHLEAEGFTPELELSADGIVVAERMLAEELPAYLAGLDRSLRGPVYRPDDLALVRSSLIERLSAHRLSPDGVIEDYLPRMLYAASDPRSATIADRVDVLRRLDAGQLAARHQEMLDPSRCALVVVGDVEPLAALPMIAERFGAWAAHDSEPTNAPPRVRDEAGARGLGLAQPLVRSYVKLVERAPPVGHGDHAAFLVLEQLLGGMFGARLNLELRERDGVSYGFHASYAANAAAGEIEMVTAVDTRHTRRAVEAMVTELRRVRGESGRGIESFELTLAKTRAREGLLAELDTARGLALQIARRVARGAEPETLGETLRELDALRAEDVEAAARRWLRPMRAPIAIVGSRGVLNDVRRAEIGELEVVDAPERRRRR